MHQTDKSQGTHNAATLATYTYNSRGQRVRKTANGGTTYWAYGEDGRLLFEYNRAGTHKRYRMYPATLIGGVNAVPSSNKNRPAQDS